MVQAKTGFILALDIGAVRIGVARANMSVGIASPLTTVLNTADVIGTISDICLENDADTLIVGLPRGLSGQQTQQTDYVEDFVAKLKAQTKLNIILQDEALTSVKAKDELSASGKTFVKEDIDALAATYILQDYLEQQRNLAK
jgi:putative Holliday junction resolvase